MKLDSKKFDFRLCDEKNFDEILRIQDEAFEILENKDILRKNTDEMLLACLNPPHITVGAWCGKVLAGFAVLYFPEKNEELAPYLKDVDISGKQAANYKLCIVREKYRGNSLQFRLGKKLEEYAKERGIDLLCATVSPDNPYSIKNMEKLGFVYNCTTEKYGGLKRNIYYKFI